MDFINAGINLFGEAIEDGVEAAGNVWDNVCGAAGEVADAWNNAF